MIMATMRAGVNRCWKCGTYETIVKLVSSLERSRFLNFPENYRECEDERECFRRSKMKMGPGRQWPGPTL